MIVAGLRSHFLAVLLILAPLEGALAQYAEIRVPELTGRVVDNAGLLSSQDRSNIDEMLRRLEATGKAQMAVLLTDSLQGNEIESYSISVVEKWQLGKKGKDNGILLVIAPNERRMRFEIGYGLEGDLTDLFSRRVIDGTLAPYFREGRYGDGILIAIERVAQQIGADLRAPVGSRIEGRSASKRSPGRIPFIFWLIFFIILARARRHRRGLFWMGGMGGSRGGFGGGGFGGGGFRGGGGRFGGGGASGSW